MNNANTRKGVIDPRSGTIVSNDTGQILGPNGYVGGVVTLMNSDPLLLDFTSGLFNSSERLQMSLYMDPTVTDTFVRMDLSFDGGSSFVNVGTFNKSEDILWVNADDEVSPTHILIRRVLGNSTYNQLVLKV